LESGRKRKRETKCDRITVGERKREKTKKKKRTYIRSFPSLFHLRIFINEDDEFQLPLLDDHSIENDDHHDQSSISFKVWSLSQVSDTISNSFVFSFQTDTTSKTVLLQ
jgi:hypothetical protein